MTVYEDNKDVRYDLQSISDIYLFKELLINKTKTY